MTCVSSLPLLPAHSLVYHFRDHNIYSSKKHTILITTFCASVYLDLSTAGMGNINSNSSSKGAAFGINYHTRASRCRIRESHVYSVLGLCMLMGLVGLVRQQSLLSSWISEFEKHPPGPYKMVLDTAAVRVGRSKPFDIENATIQAIDEVDADIKLHSLVVHMIYGLWADDEMPARAKWHKQLWLSLNSDITVEVKVHDRAECDALIENKYPHLMDVYRAAVPVQRTDLLRLLLIYEYGGVYVDIDVRPDLALNEVLLKSGYYAYGNAYDLVVFEEHDLSAAMQARSPLWPLRNGVSELRHRIANFLFFAPSPGASQLLQIAALVVYRLRRIQSLSPEDIAIISSRNNDYATLYATGPDAFTEAAFGGINTNLMARTLLVPKELTFVNQGWSSWKPDFNWKFLGTHKSENPE